MAHALFSPSGATRWMRCPGSIKACEGLEDEGSEYAAEGTLAHELAAAILEGKPRPKHDEEMLEHVTFYTELVSNLVEAAGKGAQFFVEQRLQFSETIGVDEQFGTADFVLLAGDQITLVDLKYGMGVRVDAERNEQLMIYGLAALEQFGMAQDFTSVRIIICQPRLEHTTEWVVSVQELEAFAKEVRAAVDAAQAPVPVFVPGEKQCRFCKAKASCQALASHVAEIVGADFENLDTQAIEEEPSKMGLNYLAHCMAAVPLIEDWCNAVRARVERELFDGKTIDGYKLVQGRQGPRKWTDTDAPVEILDKALGEKAFNVEIISPTQAEKALKGSPEIWKSLQQHITRSEGKPSVAPISDKRPAITAAASPDEFSTVNEA